jgi:hypothetical protein
MCFTSIDAFCRKNLSWRGVTVRILKLLQNPEGGQCCSNTTAMASDFVGKKGSK